MCEEGTFTILAAGGVPVPKAARECLARVFVLTWAAAYFRAHERAAE
jgi:hypothetical protein